MGTVRKGDIYATDSGYGLRLEMTDGLVLLCDDVDCTFESVARLRDRLLGEEADGEQLAYLVQDHLVREYTVKR